MVAHIHRKPKTGQIKKPTTVNFTKKKIQKNRKTNGFSRALVLRAGNVAYETATCTSWGDTLLTVDAPASVQISVVTTEWETAAEVAGPGVETWAESLRDFARLAGLRFSRQVTGKHLESDEVLVTLT